MNRTEYMRELDALLHGISKEEREEAMQYYNDYFDAATQIAIADIASTTRTPNAAKRRPSAVGTTIGSPIKRIQMIKMILPALDFFRGISVV